jgi:hypothetical protein
LDLFYENFVNNAVIPLRHSIFKITLVALPLWFFIPSAAVALA